MKKIWILFFLLIGLFHLILPTNALALGRKPKTETEYPALKAPSKPLSQSAARDMQVSTGEIPPITPEESAESK
ncbi:MAG: hypothetical protein HY585_02710 [Candidatus Omnitrophica bacterium]|nr:hypothetical protein [Candidatus Omnitrophota bacterium]